MPAPPNWKETFWNESTWAESTTPVFQPLPTQKKRTPYKIMAANPTPDDDDVVCALAEDLADGCHDHALDFSNIQEAPGGCALEWIVRRFKILWISELPFEAFRPRRIGWRKKSRPLSQNYCRI